MMWSRRPEDSTTVRTNLNSTDTSFLVEKVNGRASRLAPVSGFIRMQLMRSCQFREPQYATDPSTCASKLLVMRTGGRLLSR